MSFGTQTHRPIAQLKSSDTPLVVNVTSPGVSDTEFSYSFIGEVKRILIRCRNGANIKMNFESIDTSGNWMTIPGYASYSEWGIILTGKTIYLKVDQPSQVVEILTWA